MTFSGSIFFTSFKSVTLYLIFLRKAIYRWLGRSDLQATKVKRRKRKLDWKALEKDVKENPDARLIDRAKKFGTRPSAISSALKEMKITRKRKELRSQERNRESRMKYYSNLKELIKVSGSQSLVFVDESGFESFQDCAYGWSKKGVAQWWYAKNEQLKNIRL
jgi:transposase